MGIDSTNTSSTGHNAAPSASTNAQTAGAKAGQRAAVVASRVDTRGRDWRQVARLFEALPPHATEAEMSLLGSILIDPQVLGDVIFLVKRGEDFFKPGNGAIFDAVIELYDRHSAVDIVQLNQ